MTNDTSALLQVDGFPLALDRLYPPGTHMWIALSGAAGAPAARVGMDALGVETSGTLAQLSLPGAGTGLVAGRPFGQLEAAKFVGPLVSPVTGTVTAVNDAVAADPGLAERDPYGEGWLIAARRAGPAAAPAGLLADPEEITRWFTAKLADYRLTGVIAE